MYLKVPSWGVIEFRVIIREFYRDYLTNVDSKTLNWEVFHPNG